MYKCIYQYIHIHICIYIPTHTYIEKYMYRFVYTYAYAQEIFIHVHLYVNTCAYTYTNHMHHFACTVCSIHNVSGINSSRRCIAGQLRLVNAQEPSTSGRLFPGTSAQFQESLKDSSSIPVAATHQATLHSGVGVCCFVKRYLLNGAALEEGQLA